MKSKFDIKWMIIIGLAIALVWTVKSCNDKKDQITQLELDNQATQEMLNKAGQTILTQEAIVTDNKLAIKNLTDSLFNLTKAQDKRIKDVIAYYSSITKTVIKDKLVPYVDTLARKDWEDSIKAVCSNVINFYEKNYMPVPRTARVTDSNFTATLTAKIEGINIDSLSIPDSQYIRFVTIKGGILKKDASGKRHLITKRSIQVQVLHTNPLIKVTGQNSAIYIEPKKARLLEKALLIGAGIFIGTKL